MINFFFELLNINPVLLTFSSKFQLYDFIFEANYLIFSLFIHKFII